MNTNNIPVPQLQLPVGERNWSSLIEHLSISTYIMYCVHVLECACFLSMCAGISAEPLGHGSTMEIAKLQRHKKDLR